MNPLKLLLNIGQYFILLRKVFTKPEKQRIYFKQILKEMDNLGIGSIGIVAIISLFMGAVISIQTANNINSPFIPLYLVGYTVRDSIILEFSSTVVSLILAGKVGSNIASELGTMRVTEQIDALEIMGVNSASYLIFPKIIAAMVFNPLLVLMAIFVGIGGGYLGALFTGLVSTEDFIFGIQFDFRPFLITYTLSKTLVFAFIITSVSSFEGYYVKGGSLEVGQASTRAVVNSSVIILLFNVILTQLMLI